MTMGHSQVTCLASQTDTPGMLVQEWANALAMPSPHTLPPHSTHIVDREDEVRRVRQLLEEHRLVTLVGPGGVGKSCLALQVAQESLPAFQHGVYLASLDSLASPDYVVFAIAEALGFTFHAPAHAGSSPLAQVLDCLWAREALLILDNFEHLLPATSLVSDILQQAPGIKILVTSRQRLCLREEWVFQVKGLHVPESTTTLADIPTYSAVRLFLQSAHRMCADFSPTGQDLAHVAHICRLVEGLPLALELAGAWVRALPCQNIAQEIEHDLDFLTATWRDLPERHHSLRTVCDHSWSLLQEQEKDVLCALTAFRGGVTRAAAERVAGASLAVLSGLVDKSLLHWNSVSERYDLHPLLRQYAKALAKDSVQIERTRDRHCAYFAAFLHDREQAVKGHGQRQALAEIETEIGNVRQAWKWAIEHVKIEQIEQSLESVCWFYLTRGRFQEGFEILGQAADRLRQSSEPSERLWKIVCKLQACQGRFAHHLGDDEKAKELSNTFDEIDNQWGKSNVLLNLGNVADCLGHHTEACSQSLNVADETEAREALSPKNSVSSDALLEPLTERERDVLRLIAAGLTNREIAEALIVEIGTVKYHAHNIYGKLDVHSRTQASERARALELL